MPKEVKPLFRIEALRPRLTHFTPEPATVAGRERLVHWADLLDSEEAEASKETELLDFFLTDVFLTLLGYRGPADGGAGHTFRRQVKVPRAGTFPDAVLGRFLVPGEPARFVAVIEGKGPRDRLDVP